jgi:ADP-heptose:LPS heptosyltransferase
LHVSRYLIEQVSRLGWCVQDTIPRLEPSGVERSDVREWLMRNGWRDGKKPAVIHPGSGGRGKIWPLSRWWALLYWMWKVHDLPVILTLGPADEYLAEFAGAARDQLGAHPVGGLTLRRLAALLAESRFYLGNDSGVSHLAAAAGIPAGVIFGPTSPAVWAPIGPNVQVIRSHWVEREVMDWSPILASPLVELAVADWVNLQVGLYGAA